MPRRAPGSPRTLALLSLASLGWAFSFGLGAPLSSLRMHEAGCGGWLVGLNTSAYYLGVAVAAVFVPCLMRRANRACVAGGMLADALATALFPWCGGVAGWFALRLAAGAGTALSLIPMETLVNHNAPPRRRARHFAVYAACVACGMALGAVAGQEMYPSAPELAFAVGGLVTLLATLVVLWEVPARHEQPEEVSGAVHPARPANLLGFGTAWAQGFLEGGTLTFLAIYLHGLGYTTEGAGRLTGVLFVGVIVAQLPVGWLADALGRLRVLVGCHLVILGGLAVVPFCGGAAALGAWLFVLGACCGALYPLGLALLGERVGAGGLARANAWYLACNCAGSLSGPALMGLAIDGFGRRALFAAGAAAVLLVLGCWAGCAVVRRLRLGGARTRGRSAKPQAAKRMRSGLR
jgi:MFS family permease